MRDVRYLDQSGVYTLSHLIEDMMRRGVTVYLCEMHEEPSEILAELEVAPGTLPVEQIFATVEGAVEKAARQAAGETYSPGTHETRGGVVQLGVGTSDRRQRSA